MHFYVDETGHTGPNLFDRIQPVFFYDVLSSPDDQDKVAEADLAALRKKPVALRLDAVIDTLLVLQKKHRIRCLAGG